MSAFGRPLGGLHQRAPDPAPAVVGVDGTEDLGAVEVLEEVQGERRVPDEPVAVTSEPETGVRTLTVAVLALQQERLRRVVTQWYAVQRGVVDRRQSARDVEIEVADVDAGQLDAHTATSWR